jgi:prohibitin 1
VNISLRILFKPQEDKLADILINLGMEYDEKILPSIGNEVLKSIVA